MLVWVDIVGHMCGRERESEGDKDILRERERGRDR